MTQPIPWLVRHRREHTPGGRDWDVVRDGRVCQQHGNQIDATLSAVELAMDEAGRGVPGRLRVLGEDGRVVLDRVYGGDGQADGVP